MEEEDFVQDSISKNKYKIINIGCYVEEWLHTPQKRFKDFKTLNHRCFYISSV